MGKVARKKPGPKSAKTQSKIVYQRGTLGETSCDDDSQDDTSPEHSDSNQQNTTPKQRERNSTHRTMANESEFRTPDPENDATDYGLEFTTSNIMNPSPRRCSTLKTGPSSQEEQESSVGKTVEDSYVGTSRSQTSKENQTPNPSFVKPPPPKSKPTKKATQPKTMKSKSSAKNPEESETIPNESQAKQTEQQKEIVKKPRKRKTPLQLDKKFWKEVQKLQTREHLIPMLPFSRLVRELMHDYSTEVRCITPTAMEALQTSSELYLTQRLQDAFMLTLHRGRVTLDVRDMQLIEYLKINL